MKIRISLLFICLSLSFMLVLPAYSFEEKTLNNLGISKKMKADWIMPDGKGPYPALLILHTSGGVQTADIDFARKLAGRGFACLIPYYFAAYGIKHGSRQEATTTYAEAIFNDLVNELEYLKQDSRIDKNRLGAVGFSMGGYWTAVLAAKGKVQAGVSYYGAYSGAGAREKMTYQFREIIDGHSSPLLIMHGENDQTVPVKTAQNLDTILTEQKIPHELKIYPSVDHGYDRSESKADPMAASDSWERTLKFLDKYLHAR
ncbi:MAG: dienelactone hydrolase family protein [Deltaproteobacteria bacterium]|nr:dienelactone hydrolase family protein [Deltaproteobacteria bacterium]